MFDVIEIICLIINLLVFLLVWHTYRVMAYIHDMVKFFIMQKYFKGEK